MPLGCFVGEAYGLQVECIERHWYLILQLGATTFSGMAGGWYVRGPLDAGAAVTLSIAGNRFVLAVTG